MVIFFGPGLERFLVQVINTVKCAESEGIPKIEYQIKEMSTPENPSKSLQDVDGLRGRTLIARTAILAGWADKGIDPRTEFADLVRRCKLSRETIPKPDKSLIPILFRLNNITESFGLGF